MIFFPIKIKENKNFLKQKIFIKNKIKTKLNKIEREKKNKLACSTTDDELTICWALIER